MKTIKNCWVNVQRTDIISFKGRDYIVVDADARKNRTGSHIKVKAATLK